MSNPLKKIMKMKKFIFSLGLIAMLLNLTNCAQYEDVNPSVEVKGDFELYASISRTANDGLNTVWSAKDEINVFHAEAGTTNYLNDTPYLADAEQKQNPFVCNDAAAGYFLGTLHGGELDATKAYDWYAFYPYSSYIKSPANDDAGYRNVGSASNAVQTQKGNDSMAHIGGENYPMAGYAKNVAADAKPNLVFNHLSSLVEFEVVNKLSEAITVTEIAFTAEEDIVGSFYINFANPAELKFAGSGATYVSNTATLVVSEGQAIAAGQSAKFYAAIKPFTAKSGSDLTIKVSAKSATGTGAHEQDLTLKSDVVFSAGKIKPVKVNYTTVIEKPEVGEGEEVTATLSFANKAQRTTFTTSQQVWEQNGIVFTNNKGASTSNVADYAAPARCYKSSSIEVTAPGKISNIVFDANNTTYASALKTSFGTVSGATVSVSSDKVTITYSTPVDKVSIAKLSEQVRLDALTVIYISGGETPDTPDTPATPVLSVDPTTLEFGAAAGSKTVACTIENEVSGVNVTATEDVDWLSTSVSGKTVTITATENTGAERTATVTIAYEGAESKTVTVKQAAASQGGDEPAEKAWTLVKSVSDLAVGDQIIIAAKDANFAISTTQNSNNRAQTAITKSSDKKTLSTPSSSVQILTLQAGKKDGSFAFYTGKGYLYAASSSKNYLKTETTLSDNSSWSISITTAGVATIKAQGSNTRNWLRYNSSNNPPIFSCYTSGQTDVVIYKLQ